MTLRRDPITGQLRLVAPGRSERLRVQLGGCPFCAGNEHDTPHETGRVDAADGTWQARSFPNRFPLTEPHEVLVPTPRHVTRWRELTLPELQTALQLLIERREALLASGRYVHAFANDGPEAGASLAHVHAQLVAVPAEHYAEELTRGVRAGDCSLCRLLAVPESPLLVERGRHYAIVAHPLPRLGGALLLVPTEHDDDLRDEAPSELGALLHRALQALPEDVAMNLWLVADRDHDAHWYLELQPRTAYLAGVELALGVGVVARDPVETAAEARERLAIAHPAAGANPDLR